MLQHVDVGERSLSAYRGIVPEAILAEVREQARQLQGVRVLHLNATPYGGGVSELLRSLVPLLTDLGLKADWKVIAGDDGFFRATKALHNGLQGAVDDLSVVERAAYRLTSERNAQQLDETADDGAPYDVIFVHDPQPAALLSLHGKGQTRWIWRCHIDTSTPNPSVWEFFRPYLDGYDDAVFTMPQFVPPNLPIAHVSTIAPAIDPLSPKNLRLPASTARQILDWIGIQLGRPLVTQVARFDPWKDPLGVIAAYREVRREIPELQLALVGSMALDDPEGWAAISAGKREGRHWLQTRQPRQERRDESSHSIRCSTDVSRLAIVVLDLVRRLELDTASRRVRPAVDPVRDRYSEGMSPIQRLSSTVAGPPLGAGVHRPR